MIKKNGLNFGDLFLGMSMSTKTNIYDTRFRGHCNKFERPVKLPISDHSHIKDHVNMVNATI